MTRQQSEIGIRPVNSYRTRARLFRLDSTFAPQRARCGATFRKGAFQ